jgi:hypothetical protein
MKNSLQIAVLITLAIFTASCDKGYEVRFTNYYTESMDSVIIGDNKLVFTLVEFKQTTEYRTIKKGKYQITCISKSKKKFYDEMVIPSRGSGKRTIQIDGINQISVLED